MNGADGPRDRAARLEALASALIHRFNNLLMSISPHVEVIKRAGRDNDRILGAVTQIETATRRARTVMSEVSRLARPARLDVQELAVDEWFDTLRGDLQPFATSPVHLTFESAADLVISGDRDQLTRAMVHLVTNAVEAMPQGGAVTIKARTASSGIEVEVADTGDGIPPEMIGRVFDPLFTTKRNSAGLGLAVVQQIIEAHGGTMHLDSTPGAGTKVTFVLPSPREAGRGWPKAG